MSPNTSSSQSSYDPFPHGTATSDSNAVSDPYKVFDPSLVHIIQDHRPRQCSYGGETATAEDLRTEITKVSSYLSSLQDRLRELEKGSGEQGSSKSGQSYETGRSDASSSGLSPEWEAKLRGIVSDNQSLWTEMSSMKETHEQEMREVKKRVKKAEIFAAKLAQEVINIVEVTCEPTHAYTYMREVRDGRDWFEKYRSDEGEQELKNMAERGASSGSGSKAPTTTHG